MEANNSNTSDFDAFMKTRLDASMEFLNGKIGPLHHISVQSDPASIFPPNGAVIQGTNEVNKFNEKGAASFGSCIKNEFKVIHQSADEHLAYWTGFQKSLVKMKDHDKPVQFNLRITEIFRKEKEGWKLAHRHADNVKEA